MSSGSPVESVRRAFALLEELNRQRINSVQHLHEVTALPKSTIVRLLETLRLLGYVANDPRQGDALRRARTGGLTRRLTIHLRFFSPGVAQSRWRPKILR